MPSFTVFNKQSGEIRCSGTMATEEWCLAQANEGEAVYLGSVPLFHYMDVSGVEPKPVAMPPRLSPEHVFDHSTKQWVDPRNLEERKQALANSATSMRWEVESAGIVLDDGTQVRTSKDAQDRIASILQCAERAGVKSIDFKASNCWTTLSTAELEQLAIAVARHVQACFSAERAHHEAIEQLQSIVDVDAYDLKQGWPDGKRSR